MQLFFRTQTRCRCLLICLAWRPHFPFGLYPSCSRCCLGCPDGAGRNPGGGSCALMRNILESYLMEGGTSPAAVWGKTERRCIILLEISLSHILIGRSVDRPMFRIKMYEAIYIPANHCVSCCPDKSSYVHCKHWLFNVSLCTCS